MALDGGMVLADLTLPGLKADHASDSVLGDNGGLESGLGELI